MWRACVLAAGLTACGADDIVGHYDVSYKGSPTVWTWFEIFDGDFGARDIRVDANIGTVTSHGPLDDGDFGFSTQYILYGEGGHVDYTFTFSIDHDGGTGTYKTQLSSEIRDVVAKRN